jgi:hypothetical protein
MQNYINFLSQNSWIFIAALVWVLPWKGIALWKAAKNNSKIWFVILLIVNTMAILEILYIFIFSRKKEEPERKLSFSPDMSSKTNEAKKMPGL